MQDGLVLLSIYLALIKQNDAKLMWKPSKSEILFLLLKHTCRERKENTRGEGMDNSIVDITIGFSISRPLTTQASRQNEGAP